MKNILNKLTKVLVILALFTVFIIGNTQTKILGLDNPLVSTAEASYCYGTGFQTIYDPNECEQNGGQWVSDPGSAGFDEFCVRDLRDPDGTREYGPSNADLCTMLGYYWYAKPTGEGSNGGNDGSGNGGNGGYTPPPPPSYSVNFNSSVSNNTVTTTDKSSSEMKQTIIENKEVSMGNMSNGNENKLKMFFSDTVIANSKKYKNYYQPELTITDNNVSYTLPVKTNTVGSASKDSLNTVHKEFTATLNNVDLFAYSVDKVGDLPNDLLTLLNSNKGLVASTKLDSKESLYNLNDFRVSNSGNYIFIAKANFKDSKKETLYAVNTVQLQDTNRLSKLPVKNRLSIMLDSSKINEGKLSANHNFNSLNLPSLDSMKILSAYDATNRMTLVGSVNGGLKMFNSENAEVPLTIKDGNNDLKVSQILPMGDCEFVVTTYNDGMHVVNTDDRTVSKLATLTENKINATATNESLIVTASDNNLVVLKIDNTELHVRNQLSSKDIFGENIKLGEVNLVGGKIIVNSLYNQNNFKTAVITF